LYKKGRTKLSSLRGGYYKEAIKCSKVSISYNSNSLANLERLGQLGKRTSPKVQGKRQGIALT
jgi:hypothetical protein